MNLLIMSDLHQEHGDFQPDLSGLDVDCVILAGDIGPGLMGIDWALKSFSLPVIYVAGNHELYSRGHTIPNLYQQMRDRTKGTHVHFLENEAVEINGTHFLGASFWTDFQLFGTPIAKLNAAQLINDYRYIRIETPSGDRKITVDDTIMRHYQSRLWLLDKLDKAHEKRVIVTHHAPSDRSIAPQYKSSLLSAGYASRHDDLVEQSNANLWIHGHCHFKSDYRLANTRIVCNPRGYPGEETGFDKNFKVTVD